MRIGLKVEVLPSARKDSLVLERWPDRRAGRWARVKAVSDHLGPSRILVERVFGVAAELAKAEVALVWTDAIAGIDAARVKNVIVLPRVLYFIYPQPHR